MNRLKLKRLLWVYRNEINSGELTHVKDLIAIFVINDLSYIFPVDQLYNFNEITLNSLLDKSYMHDDKYRVPSLSLLKEQKEKYMGMLKRKVIPLRTDRYNAAITWIESMIEFKIINEGDLINLNDYVLSNFISDDRLITMFKDNISKKKIKRSYTW